MKKAYSFIPDLNMKAIQILKKHRIQEMCIRDSSRFTWRQCDEIPLYSADHCRSSGRICRFRAGPWSNWRVHEADDRFQRIHCLLSRHFRRLRRDRNGDFNLCSWGSGRIADAASAVGGHSWAATSHASIPGHFDRHGIRWKCSQARSAWQDL